MNIDSQISNEIHQLVSFKLGKEEFGIDILRVHEINRMLNLTRLPNAPYYIDGVVNLRGRVIPVVNLRVKLGMERKEADRNSRIVVVELSGKIIGFLVDEVNEVLRIPENITEQPLNSNQRQLNKSVRISNSLITLQDNRQWEFNKLQRQVKISGTLLKICNH